MLEDRVLTSASGECCSSLMLLELRRVGLASHATHQCILRVGTWLKRGNLVDDLTSSIEGRLFVCAEGKSMRDASPVPKGSNFNVLVRIRPPSEAELHHDQAVEAIGTTRVHVSRSIGEVGNSSVFQSDYDHVKNNSANQSEMFELVEGRIVEAINGYNSSIFAYGPTGTGKTYTMMGDTCLDGSGDHLDEQSGIIPRAVCLIFDKLRDLDKTATVYCSYMEIYSDRLHDLFQPYKPDYMRDPLDMVQKKAGLEIREDGEGNLFVPDLMTVRVTNAHTVEKLINRGNKNRAVRHTELNQHSSRSHTILQLVLEQRSSCLDVEDQSGDVVRSKINFVDLAGSERWNTNHELSDERISEMNFINSSLSSLVCVVSALTENAHHIPYRCSKLTHLLKDSLGGNCKTAMIFTLSPSTICFEETCSTLRFADRARNITNNPVINVQEDLTWVLERKDKEISRLRQLVALLSKKKNNFLEAECGQDKEEGSEVNPPYSPDKIHELRQEIADLRQALQHERDLHSNTSLCNDQVLGSDSSSICVNTAVALSRIKTSAFSDQSNVLDGEGNADTTDAVTEDLQVSSEILELSEARISAKASASVTTNSFEGKDLLEASHLHPREPKMMRVPSRVCSAKQGTHSKKSELLENLSTEVHLYKNNLSMYGENKRRSRRTNSRGCRHVGGAINQSKINDLANDGGMLESASVLEDLTSDQIMGLTLRDEDSLEQFQDRMTGKDCAYYSRLSDPGTPATCRDYTCVAPSVSDNHMYKKIPGWGRSSILESHSPVFSPLNQNTYNNEVSSPGTDDPGMFDVLLSPHHEAIPTIGHSEALDNDMAENLYNTRDQEYFSDANFLRYKSTWEKSIVRGSYDSDSSLLCNTFPEPIRRGRSEILTMRTNKKQPLRRSKTLHPSRSMRKMDAGSLIYMLGASSSSLKAMKIAEILRE